MCSSATLLILTAGLTLGLPVPQDAFAQGNPPGTVTVSSSVTGIHQFTADLDAGGTLDWSSMTIQAGVNWQLVPAFAAGLSLRYDDSDWRFRSATAFGAEAPWNRLQRRGGSLNLSLALSPHFVIGVSPTFEATSEPAAKTEDALAYGAVLSATGVFSPTFVLGAGVSVTQQFYSVKTSPFVIVNWKLTEKLRVANALPAGPQGGAGVELRYALTPDWELAGGGVYRSDRWRLEGSGPDPANVAETSFIPLLARVTRKFGPKLRIDLYTGLLTNNSLRIVDSDGNELLKENVGIAPLFAATLWGKF